MAKVGLNFGEKLQIADKQYRVLNDGLVDLKQIFGKMLFGRIEGQDVIYEEDTTQPRRQDGSYPTVSTGEIRGIVVSAKSQVQHQSLFITITDQSLSDIEALNLKNREEVDFDNIVVTYSSVGNNQFKLFASAIKRVGTNQTPKQQKQEEHKG